MAFQLSFGRENEKHQNIPRVWIMLGNCKNSTSKTYLETEIVIQHIVPLHWASRAAQSDDISTRDKNPE